MFFSALGVRKGFLTMLLAHIMFCIPYVMLSVMPKLRSLDPNLADAALDLGATPWQALIKVIVPQIMPGIVSGALVAFTMSFDDFVISYFVTGNGVNNISILVYTMRVGETNSRDGTHHSRNCRGKQGNHNGVKDRIHHIGVTKHFLIPTQRKSIEAGQRPPRIEDGLQLYSLYDFTDLHVADKDG